MDILDGFKRRFSNSNVSNNLLRMKHLAHISSLLDSLRNQTLMKNDEQGGPSNPWHNAGNSACSALKLAIGSILCGRREISLTVSKWQLNQGDTLAVLVAVPPAQSFVDKLHLALRKRIWNAPLVQVALEGCDTPAYPISRDPNLWRALFPTTPLENPGPRSLTVEVRDGRHKQFLGVVEVLEKEYPVESLWFSEVKSAICGTRKELDAVEGLVSTKTSEQYWHDPFLLPTEGVVTTQYGVRRYYNGKFAERYFHRGVDYGAVEGTPVRAPACGRVALIGYERDGFELHGNCVGLDHGQGVTSLLMHLSSICVQEGMMIQAGDMVGTVGETGLATGPHLHWGLHVHGKAVDPSSWML